MSTRRDLERSYARLGYGRQHIIDRDIAPELGLADEWIGREIGEAVDLLGESHIQYLHQTATSAAERRAEIESQGGQHSREKHLRNYLTDPQQIRNYAVQSAAVNTLSRLRKGMTLQSLLVNAAIDWMQTAQLLPDASLAADLEGVGETVTTIVEQMIRGDAVHGKQADAATIMSGMPYPPPTEESHQ